MKKEFYLKLIEVANNLSIKPEDLLLVLYIESGLNPAARNPNGGAVGLNQFYGKAFDENVGVSGITEEEYSRYSAEEQLPFIEKFFRTSMGGRTNLSSAQLYLSNFIPAALNFSGVKNEDRNTVIAELGSRKTYGKRLSFNAVYNANKSLDFNNDGKITYGDIEDICEQKKQSSIFQKHLKNIDLARRGEEVEEIISSKEPTTAQGGKKIAALRFIEKITDAMRDAIKEFGV